MCLQPVEPGETVGTVSARVRLCTGVNADVTLQRTAAFKPLSALVTAERSSVAVHLYLVFVQALGPAEALVAL